MCRSIKTLRRVDQPASQKNLEAFEAAVAEIATASRRLLESIGPVEPISQAAAPQATAATSHAHPQPR